MSDLKGHARSTDAGPHEHEREQDRASGATILVVDDEPNNQFAFATVLEELNERIVPCSSGAEALRFLLHNDCAVILLDVNMPDMDGYETAELIRGRERSRQIPIIFVSAINKDDTHIRRAYGLGAVDYVFKPVDPIVLKSKVAVFVELFKRTAEVREQARLEQQLQAENMRVRAEKIEAERALFQSQKMDAVGQLTGGLAHDFNNMLTVVIGNLDALGRALKGTGRNADRVQMALTGAMNCAELTRRLLAFASRQPLQATTIDFSVRVANVVQLLGRTLGENIEVQAEVPDDLRHGIADAAQVESALMNLAVNARDAMPNGGSLRIAAANVSVDADIQRLHQIPQGEYVMLSVSDNGQGMPPEVVTRAFEPFFTTKRTGRGTGLGLSMVYGFVKQSGGHVTIDSTPHVGTSVRLYFPAQPRAALGESAIKTPAATAITGNGRRILLVEDDAGVRAVTAAFLRELQFNVLEAENAADALMQLRAADTQIDLLFTDVVMPGGMDGIELAAAARRLHSGLRVLLTSGYSDSFHRNTELGELLTKPYREADLLRKLQHVLGEA